MSATAINRAISNAATLFLDHHDLLYNRIAALDAKIHSPDAIKSLRLFNTKEVSQLMPVTEANLRRMVTDKKGVEPRKLPNRSRRYSLDQINELRRYFANLRPDEAQEFVPHRRNDEHLQILSLTNFKGGSAKTTTTLHLAHYLALRGYRVLAIDMDPQASFTSTFGSGLADRGYGNETIYSCLRYDEDRRPIQDLIKPTYFDGIDIIPGGLEVMEFEFTAPQELAGTSGQRDELFVKRMSNQITQIADDYDIVLLDSPPSLGYLSLVSFFAATSLVITVHPAMIDADSLSQFLSMFGQLTEDFGEAGVDLSKDAINYCITRYNPSNQPQTNIVAMLRGLFGEHIFAPEALHSAAVETAGLAKSSIYEMTAKDISAATLDRALESMDAVNGAILNSILENWGRVERSVA